MYKNITLNKLSEILFLIGIFLLASAMSIGIFLILISSIVSLLKRKDNPLKDKWTLVLITISTLMVTSCLYQTFSHTNKDLVGWDISLTWIGLLNWIPFFYLFISTKDFLNTSEKRLKVSILLLSGSFPVLVTGFGQYFFNWHGPISFFNGLITWYLKPIEPHLGLSGLFSNQNYAGTWMSLIWPLSLSLFFINKVNIYKRISALLILFLITFAIILTTSRNALFSFLISIPILMGIKSLLIILVILLLLIFIIYFQSNFIIFGEMSSFLSNIFPRQFFNKFSKFNLTNILEYRRINLWKDSVNLISSKPLFGLGAASFPILYELYYQPKSFTEQHTHNLFLEISAGYGFIVSSMIFLFIFSLIYYSWKELSSNSFNIKQSLINKSWLASTTVLLISQMNDITYYDGRISVMFWIFLSGLRNIIEERHDLSKTNTNSLI